MPKRGDIEELYEFRILFTHKGESFTNDRHFTAMNVKSAIEMFEFACRKDELDVEIVQIEKWNRWADRWENADDKVEENVDLVS